MKILALYKFIFIKPLIIRYFLIPHRIYRDLCKSQLSLLLKQISSNMDSNKGYSTVSIDEYLKYLRDYHSVLPRILSNALLALHGVSH